MKRFLFAALALLPLLASPAISVPSVVPAPHAGSVSDALVAVKPSKNYPLKRCLVSGELLKADRLAFTYKGQEVQFCCQDCVTTFKQNPDKYLAQLPKHSH